MTQSDQTDSKPHRLGRTAAHIARNSHWTKCGLRLEEAVPVGTVVQRPARWPYRRCRRCWR